MINKLTMSQYFGLTLKHLTILRIINEFFKIYLKVKVLKQDICKSVFGQE